MVIPVSLAAGVGCITVQAVMWTAQSQTAGGSASRQIATTPAVYNKKVRTRQTTKTEAQILEPVPWNPMESPWSFYVFPTWCKNSMEYFTWNPTDFPRKISRFPHGMLWGIKPGPVLCTIAEVL